MKKAFIVLFCLCYKSIVAQDVSFSEPGNSYYNELSETLPDQGQEWLKLEENIFASFASTNERYQKGRIPEITYLSSWSTRAWKGEKVHTQVLVWTKTDIPELSIETENLYGEGGTYINLENIKTGFVRYVITNTASGSAGSHPFLSADPIDIIKTIPVSKNTVQPIWISIHIPEDIFSGTYKGKINVFAGKKFTFEIIIDVSDHVLPPPSEWKYDLDLWQHPASIARVHNVPVWSNEHFEIMRPYFTMLANAGQKVITASIVHEPWNHQTYDDYPSLIKWIRKADGSRFYDYSLFDKYVEFVMSCGIIKRINCYSLAPWSSLSYYDEGVGKDVTLQTEIGSTQYRAVFMDMLKDFTRHLKEKGWFNITAIAADEQKLPVMQAMISMIKQVDPGWKVALAGNSHPEIEADIFDYCLYIEWPLFSDSVLRYRKALGKPSTFYTCCGPLYPNGFTFSPPVEHVWLGWYAASKGFTGYLRWAYNSWPANPLTDSRYIGWAGGDTYQVYPGPRSSIRFEKLIEGIQDYEKIRMVRELYYKQKSCDKIKELESILDSFDIEQLKDIPAERMVIQAQRILNEL